MKLSQTLTTGYKHEQCQNEMKRNVKTVLQTRQNAKNM